MVNLGPLGPMMQEPISQEAVERIRGEFKAAYSQPVNRWRGIPIVPAGAARYSPFIEPPKAHYAFICAYCGRASQSVEPCQGCGALRTREQLELWTRMGL